MPAEQTVATGSRAEFGLGVRTAFAVAGLLAVFACCAVALEWAADRRQAENQAVLVVQDRAAVLARQVAEALSVSDRATLETVAQAMADQPAALGVLVFDTDGQSLFAAGRDLDAATDARSMALAAKREAPTVLLDSARILVTAPVRLNGNYTGAVAMAVERAPLERGHGGSALRLGILLLGMLAIAIPVAFAVGDGMSAPLRRITTWLDKYGDRELSERIGPAGSLFSTRELSALMTSCNGMADRVQVIVRRLQQMAYSDTATGLPNHERFSRDVAEFLDGKGPDYGAIFVVRLDRLDRIFDAVGQDAGDELLARIVGRMTQAVRAIDRMVRTEACAEKPSRLARLRNGDFAVLAPSLRGPEEAGRFAQLLASALNQPFDWREHKLVLGAVIGAAMLPTDGPDPDTAIRHALLAMASAKSDAAKMKFFTKSLDREANAQLAFEREMRAGLERGEFKAYFQPKIDLMTGRVIGAEALARWVKPDRSMVSPGRFIPAAEENGLIGAISEIIMRDACWKAAAWAREGFPLSVAINISPLQFADERFTDRVQRVMAEAGVSPNRVELEVTESVALENPERALRLLDPLRAMGVKVSLDDFGCGHSSLASLTRLPFDIIKIDQQFVRALAKDRHAPAIIEMILAMAASLDYIVVAEGVETESEAEFLRRRGCQIGQGFLYGAAMPPAEFLRFNIDRASSRGLMTG